MIRAAALAALFLSACLIPVQPQQGQQVQRANPPAGGGGQAGAAPAPAYESAPAYGSAPAPAAAAPAAPAPPVAPSVVSITLRNSCPDTVKVFFGDKPRFGSGTYSSLSSNSVTSKQMKPGDQIWIVDDSQNGVASASASTSVRTIEVTSSCTGFTTR